MKLNKDIFDVANSGQAIGVNKACGRVTIDPDWQLNSTASTWGGSPRGPFRYYQSYPSGATPTPATIEVELPNIKTINIDRSMSQDIGTCKISMYNQWHDRNGMSPLPEILPQPSKPGSGQLGKPGYFWPERGGDQWSQELWNQQPSVGALQKDGTVDEAFEWTNAIVPNALVRTYQGYGGHDLSIDEALSQGKIMLTGVWLVDSISAGTEGMLNLECRDIGRLLLEQTVYPPVVPDTLYPLEYFPAGKNTFDSPWGARPSPEGTDLNVSQAAFSEERCFYKEASTDTVRGDNAAIGPAGGSHRPSDAADGNNKNYAWSKGSTQGTKAGNQAYWEFWVGNTLRDAQTMTFDPNIVQAQQYWGDTENAYGEDRRILASGASSAQINGSVLVMQGDGNLVLYQGRALDSAVDLRGVPAWSTQTQGYPGAYMEVEPGGRWSVKSVGGRILWEAGSNASVLGSAGHPNTTLVLQWDGNLVLYAPDAMSERNTFGGSGVSGLGNNAVIWEAGRGRVSAITGEKPKPVSSVSFTPWAGGSIAYISAWDLQTGAWAAPAGPIPDTAGAYNIGYVSKASIPLRMVGEETEINVTFPIPIYTNRIRITLIATPSLDIKLKSGQWLDSGLDDYELEQGDPGYNPNLAGRRWRCGLRSVYCRVKGIAASAYSGDPNAQMWTYAFDAHPTRGYWVTDSNGVVYGFGDAADYDSTSFGSPDIATAGPWGESKELFRQDAVAPLNTYIARWLDSFTSGEIDYWKLRTYSPPVINGQRLATGNGFSAPVPIEPIPWPRSANGDVAYWITDNVGTAEDSFADSERWFRKTVTINTVPGAEANLYWTGDNECEFFINRPGMPLRVENAQKGNNWTYAFSKTLENPDDGQKDTFSGEYELTFRVKNLSAVDGTNFNPASLIWALVSRSPADIAANPSRPGVATDWSNKYTEVSTYGNFMVDMAATPSGEGYWLLDRYGHIYNYGDAAHYGDLILKRADQIGNAGSAYSGSNGMDFGLSGRQAIGVCRTSTGNGYWVLYTDGNVYGFGDARYQQSEDELDAGRAQTYRGYYDENLDYLPGNIVTHMVNLLSPLKYWKRKNYPTTGPNVPGSHLYEDNLLVGGGAGNTPAVGNYWTDISDSFFPSEYDSGTVYPSASVVYYQGSYWRRKFFLFDPTPHTPAVDAYWEKLSLIPGTYATPSQDTDQYTSTGSPSNLPPPSGPMTGPMRTQKVPYVYKLPERVQALGYRLYTAPASSYDWARRGTAICSHPTKQGFWMTDGSGQVWAYGDAANKGELKIRTYNKGMADSFSLELFDWATSIEPTKTGDGYWISFGSGKIAAFGDAVGQGPVDIYEKNPELNKFGAAISTNYTDDYGNDWTKERNNLWGLRRDPDGRGFWVLKASGSVHSYDAEDWGQPGSQGYSGFRWHDSNIDDYSDIVKDLAAWCGFTAYSEDVDIRTEYKNRAPIWGNIESTGIFSDSRLPGDRWDRRTALDCINQVKQIVGYNFFIDDRGGIRFESPNWWQAGNFDEDGAQIAVRYDINNDWERVLKLTPPYNEVSGLGETWQDFLEREGAENFIPEIHEGVNMMGYSAMLDGSSYVSEIIIGADQPDFRNPESANSFIRFIPDNSVSAIRPGPDRPWKTGQTIRANNNKTYTYDADRNMWIVKFSDTLMQVEGVSPAARALGIPDSTSGVPALRNINRVAAWVDNYFINPEEQQTMAELINLQIWFNQRVGNIAMIGNPNIGMNDQIRVVERNTSETYIHYVRSVSSSMDLDTGSYTMNLSTNRLGDDSNWVITTDDESYNPMNQIAISSKISDWQDGLGRRVPLSGKGPAQRPTLDGGFRRS